jgi:hypothetical protein
MLMVFLLSCWFSVFLEDFTLYCVAERVHQKVLLVEFESGEGIGAVEFHCRAYR